MKRITIIITVVAAMVFSCTSPEKKAQKLIKQYLMESLDDQKSYESVNFGSLDSVIEEELTKEYYDIGVKYSICMTLLDRSLYTINDSIKCASYIDSIGLKVDIDSAELYKELLIKMAEEGKEFVMEFIGLSMKHKFRAKNKMNATILNEIVFYFDKDITKIIDIEKLNND